MISRTQHLLRSSDSLFALFAFNEIFFTALDMNKKKEGGKNGLNPVGSRRRLTGQDSHTSQKIYTTHYPNGSPVDFVIGKSLDYGDIYALLGLSSEERNKTLDIIYI